MKALNYFELEAILAKLKDNLILAKLENVCVLEQSVFIKFYHKNYGIKWLLIDLKSPPIILLSDTKPLETKGLIKPISLFFKKHGFRKSVKNISLAIKPDRRVFFDLDNFKMEIILIDKAKNLKLFTSEKNMYFLKPREINKAVLTINKNIEVRTYDEIEKEYYLSKRLEKIKSTTVVTKKIEDSKVLEKLINTLSELKLKPYKDIINNLKNIKDLNQMDNLNTFSGYLDLTKSVHENLAILAKKNKTNQASILKLEKRVSDLKNNKATLVPKNKSILSELKIKGHRLQISDFLIEFGKNAKNNLDLLRAAKPWDLWMHLKNLPSSHILIRKNKKQRVNKEDLLKIAKYFLEKNRKFGSYEFVFSEVRFIHPIKGDKLGRVKMSKYQSFIIKI